MRTADAGLPWAVKFEDKVLQSANIRLINVIAFGKFDPAYAHPELGRRKAWLECYGEVRVDSQQSLIIVTGNDVETQE